MERAAKALDFIEAARLRDEMFVLDKKIKILRMIEEVEKIIRTFR